MPGSNNHGRYQVAKAGISSVPAPLLHQNAAFVLLSQPPPFPEWKHETGIAHRPNSQLLRATNACPRLYFLDRQHASFSKCPKSSHLQKFAELGQIVICTSKRHCMFHTFSALVRCTRPFWATLPTFSRPGSPFLVVNTYSHEIRLMTIFACCMHVSCRACGRTTAIQVLPFPFSARVLSKTC